MNWFSRLTHPRSDTTTLDIAMRETLSVWQHTPAPDLGKSHFETRYVVLNTESSGMNVDTDRVLSVAAIALAGGTLASDQSYHAQLEPDPVTALVKLLTFVGGGPVVVFGAALNRVMLERTLLEHLGIQSEWLWLDLHCLLPAIFPEKIARPTRLNEWMRAFDIETFQRHHALGDAYAIAQLMLAVEGRSTRRGMISANSLAELERSHRRLNER